MRQRLPLRGERLPQDRPRQAIGDPHSCCDNNEGKDPMALVRDIGGKFRMRPDTSNRVPIVLDEVK